MKKPLHEETKYEGAEEPLFRADCPEEDTDDFGNLEPFAGRDEPLSEEEISLLREGAAKSEEERGELPHHDNSSHARVKRAVKQNKLFTAAIIVIVLGLIGGAVIGAFAFIQWRNSLPNTDDFTVILGDPKKPVEVKYEHWVRDGVFYVDMKMIAAYGDLTVSGSNQRMQFTSADVSFLRFEHDSEYAVINGEQILMEVTPLEGGRPVVAKAIVSGTECLVPYEVLLKSVADGLLFRFERKTNTLTVKREILNEEDEELATPVRILFRPDYFTVIPPETEPPKYQYSYLIDVGPYLDAINAEYLLLANKQHPLGEDFRPNLVDLTCKTDGEKQQMEADAARALYAMMQEMHLSGINDIYVTSSYRSYAQQQWLYYSYYYTQEKSKHPDWSDELIYAQISTYSSKPGESEHQTGLCVDFSSDAIGGELNNQFETTEAFAWLRDNAHKFGFILRYPSDKVPVTGYSYESWHFRFVGRDAASEIYFNNLCFEEYLSGVQETQ